AGALAGGERMDVDVADAHPPRTRRQQTGHGPQQRRLAAAVGPEQRGHAARLRRQRRPADDVRALAVSGDDRLDGDVHGMLLAVEPRTTSATRTGPPTMAVIRPTGTVTGSSDAMTAQPEMSAAPAAAEATGGAVGARDASRASCGATSAT